jgi:hypothetical protein
VFQKTKYRILCYVAAWVAALVATDPSLGLWSLAWMFPVGLFAFFFPEHRQEGGWWVIIAVMAVYIVHAVFYFRAKSSRSTLILAGVLVVLLICNVAGCRAMVHAH